MNRGTGRVLLKKQQQSNIGLSLSSRPSVAVGKQLPKKSEYLKAKLKKKGKIFVGLPTVESLEKEKYVMTIDGPPLIKCRLERLMGTNKISIMDAKFLEKFISSLEEDEHRSWERKRKGREEAENQRIRKLAIDGIIEPGPDMQDLRFNPVFRANRILNRINQMDHSFGSYNASRRPRKICIGEPFHEEEFIDTGILFGFHEKHYRKIKPSFINLKRINQKSEIPSSTKMIGKSETSSRKEISTVSLIMKKASQEKLPNAETNDQQNESESVNPTPSSSEEDVEVDDSEEEEWGGEDYPLFDDRPKSATGQHTKMIQNCMQVLQVGSKTTGLINQKSGNKMRQNCFEVDEKLKENMEKKWSTKKSKLVDKLFDPTDPDANELYKYAKELLEAYKRETLAADKLTSKYLK